MTTEAAEWFGQGRYQVRTEWGVAGLARLAPTDVVVVIDALRFSTTVIGRVGRGEHVPLDEMRGESINGLAVVESAVATGATVLVGGLGNAAAVADATLAIQLARARRTSVAVIAAGERAGRRRREPDAPVRFAVEDHLGAGAVIDALAARGIDHSSPEAAVAAAAFAQLRGAVRHLLTASGSGQELAAKGRAAEIADAAAIDATTVVPTVVAGELVAFGG